MSIDEIWTDELFEEPDIDAAVTWAMYRPWALELVDSEEVDLLASQKQRVDGDRRLLRQALLTLPPLPPYPLEDSEDFDAFLRAVGIDPPEFNTVDAPTRQRLLDRAEAEVGEGGMERLYADLCGDVRRRDPSKRAILETRERFSAKEVQKLVSSVVEAIRRLRWHVAVDTPDVLRLKGELDLDLRYDVIVREPRRVAQELRWRLEEVAGRLATRFEQQPAVVEARGFLAGHLHYIVRDVDAMSAESVLRELRANLIAGVAVPVSESA